jgi:hypothetical protein
LDVTWKLKKNNTGIGHIGNLFKIQIPIPFLGQGVQERGQGICVMVNSVVHNDHQHFGKLPLWRHLKSGLYPYVFCREQNEDNPQIE